MIYQHPQEKLIETFDFNGATVELVEWTDTIWSGRIEYAVNNTDEPDVEKMSESYFTLNGPPVDRCEGDWSVCISVNYLSSERPNGVMFGSQVSSEQQPDGFDILKVPAGQYMRVKICDETAKALGHEPWTGGIPPYGWIGEEIAPKFGYKYGSNTLPVYEYYYYNSEKQAHEVAYLYVPVEKA